MDELKKVKFEKNDTLESATRDSGCECHCNGCGCGGNVLKESIKSNLELPLSSPLNVQREVPDYKGK